MSPTGRPRDSSIDRAVTKAALAALDEVGYSRFSIDDVARRAGATKPAIYRRWPSRQHLMLAALATRMHPTEAPDTGCTICDLSDAMRLFVDAFNAIDPDVLGPLHADCAQDLALREEFMTALFKPPRQAVAQTLERARDRGDLREDLDEDLALDLLGSLVHYRALFGHAGVEDREIDTAVRTVLRGISDDYPRLLKISKRKKVAGHAGHSHHH